MVRNSYTIPSISLPRARLITKCKVIKMFYLARGNVNERGRGRVHAGEKWNKCLMMILAEFYSREAPNGNNINFMGNYSEQHWTAFGMR